MKERERGVGDGRGVSHKYWVHLKGCFHTKAMHNDNLYQLVSISD